MKVLEEPSAPFALPTSPYLPYLPHPAYLPFLSS